jgi:CBS domain-containing protein
VFILAVFLCVVLHEFGHTLTARRYGIKPRGVILLPIGGVARLERLPTKPLQELWVALAGPAVNIAITVGLFIWLNISASFEPIQKLTDFKTLQTNHRLERAVELNLAGSQKDFPVMENGRIRGILTQSDLLKALSARDRHPTVDSAVQKSFVTADSLEMLETAFAKLKGCNCRTLAVTPKGKRVGLLTVDNLGSVSIQRFPSRLGPPPVTTKWM